MQSREANNSSVIYYQLHTTAKGEAYAIGSNYIAGECYWAITAQLIEQKKPVAKLMNWLPFPSRYVPLIDTKSQNNNTVNK